MKQNTKSKKMTMGLLLVYLIVLTWIIVFKMEFDISLLQCTNFRNINLIPFGASLVVNGHIDASEILLNVIAFIPFGIYLSIVKNEWNFFQKVLPIFLVSLSYVPYKIGKLQIQGFSEPITSKKIKQSYHITQKAARSRPRAAFLRGKLGRRQKFSKK